MITCVVCDREAALLHQDEGYCVWHYRQHPFTLLKLVRTP